MNCYIYFWLKYFIWNICFYKLFFFRINIHINERFLKFFEFLYLFLNAFFISTLFFLILFQFFKFFGYSFVGFFLTNFCFNFLFFCYSVLNLLIKPMWSKVFTLSNYVVVIQKKIKILENSRKNKIKLCKSEDQFRKWEKLRICRKWCLCESIFLGWHLGDRVSHKKRSKQVESNSTLGIKTGEGIASGEKG